MLFPPSPDLRIVGRPHLLSFPFHQHSIPILLLLAKNNRNETNLDRPHRDVEISSYEPFVEHLLEFFVCKLTLFIRSKPHNRTFFMKIWVTIPATQSDRSLCPDRRKVWADFLYMMLCLISSILQRRASDPRPLSFSIIFSKFSAFQFSSSRSALDFILASEFFFVDERVSDWLIQNILEWSSPLIG